MKEILNRIEISKHQLDLIEDGLLYSGSTSAVWKYVYRLTLHPTTFLVPIVIDAEHHKDNGDLEALRVLQSLLTMCAAKIDEIMNSTTESEQTEP
jgi:hypothetical protein